MLRRLDELENEDWTKPDTLERLRRAYSVKISSDVAASGGHRPAPP